MGLTIITAPTVEPITVAESRRQLQMGSSAGIPAPPAPAVSLLSPAAAGNCDNGDHRVGVTFTTVDGETELGPLSAVVTIADKSINGQIAVAGIAIGGFGVAGRKVYLVPVAGGAAKLASTIANNADQTATLNIADAALGVAAPTANTTTDPELVRRIVSVRDRGEFATARAWITQTVEERLNGFPCEPFIELPLPPLQSVTFVKYLDAAGVLQTFVATDQYDVINGHTPPVLNPRAPRGLIALKPGVSWPSTYGQKGSVVVRFVCGYGDTAAAVPSMFKDAMLMDLANLTGPARDGLIVGMTATEVPGWAGRVYQNYRSYPTQKRAA